MADISLHATHNRNIFLIFVVVASFSLNESECSKRLLHKTVTQYQKGIFCSAKSKFFFFSCTILMANHLACLRHKKILKQKNDDDHKIKSQFWHLSEPIFSHENQQRKKHQLNHLQMLWNMDLRSTHKSWILCEFYWNWKFFLSFAQWIFWF